MKVRLTRAAAGKAIRSRSAKLADVVGVVDGATCDRPDLREALLILLAQGRRVRVREVARILDTSESTLRRRYSRLRLHLRALALDCSPAEVRQIMAQSPNG